MIFRCLIGFLKSVVGKYFNLIVNFKRNLLVFCLVIKFLWLGFVLMNF